jgi:hypothetical protein
MPEPVTINPKNSGTITLGPTGTLKDVHCQIVNWRCEPEANDSAQPGTFCAAPTTVPGKSSWFAAFDYLQDWGATDSLSQLLFDHDGEALDFTFRPDVDTVPTVKGTLYARAGAFGGGAGEVWQSSGRCPLIAAPTFEAAPAADAPAPAPPVEPVTVKARPA